MAVSRDELYLKTLRETQGELLSVRSSGNWLVVCGLVGALCLVLGSIITVIAWLGFDQLSQISPLWYLGGTILLTGPALALILAGFLARQSLRTSRANTLILRASQMLLMPAEAAGQRIDTLASKVREETGRVDELIETAQASLASMKDTLSGERSQIEHFVNHNTNTIEAMMLKLADERQSLAELSVAVEEQTAAISEAIPRQARAMAEAAREAQREVAKADSAVDERLKSLDESGRQLGERLSALDEMSVEAEARAQRLTAALSAIEVRLRDSAKTVEASIKASELAADAATETGDALNAAVASALDGTREASEFIRQQARDAVAEARKAMAELKAAGENAREATLSAGQAARTQAEETEQRISAMSERMFDAATRATAAADAGLERARQRIERASALLSGMYDPDPLAMAPPPAPSHQPAPQPAPVAPPPPAAMEPQQPTPEPPGVTPAPQLPEEPAAPYSAPKPELRPRQEDAVFSPLSDQDPDDEQDVTGSNDTSNYPVYDMSDPTVGHANRDMNTDNEPSDVTDEEESSLFDLAFDRVSHKEMGLSWKDLLSGLGAAPEERDEAARHILSEVNDAGVALGTLLSSRETRKIASAARKSDLFRRRAVREYAGAAVQKLTYRMEDDPHFRSAVDRFLASEESDAERTLREAEKSRTEASARLAAYLVLDTAFTAMNAN